ncbi:TetR/AcrR family transcriptional regulator [Streptomyces sp. RLB3-17]|nr:TetR/AcrR family transcriptional regulator [Streptomyces sp. S1A1-7]QDO04397.1 TetR/AcrR family transcriptional regulator [Streptomyces sp. RLB1-9]QDO26188.1 TetR/AcrR family transcriptional regulator [Streptomyces sp. S1A1-8]QDO36302.1 TetR/AcrR family transcriptional regulator [Streptomyces sp. S1A1-3]QDO46338.1 TetR/AcrR family transcriptional regulator [Streptomyces sp. RLB3-17]
MAAELVANSPDGDVSTRAVCEAAGVGAPALYRHFGDKEGLLSAVVDHGYEKYLTTKRSRRPGTDPIQDLRDGWDTHTDFALRNPNLYRLMNSPAMRTPPAAALESHRILTADLRRAAEQGKLRLAPELAAQMIMSANVGVSLMLVSRPTTFTDETLSRRIRDAVHAVVFTPEAMGPETTSAGDEETGAEDEEAGPEEVLPATATHLAALLRRTPRPDFTPGESALLGEWLDRLSNTTPE